MTKVAPTDAPTDAAVAALEAHRAELTGYCYRMLGGAFEAEDAVQETMVRAWRHYDQYESRAPLRSWLFRIATNVCFDLLERRRRRAMPMDLVEPGTGEPRDLTAGAEHIWLQPIPDSRVLSPTDDPAEVAEARDSIRVAFVAALQYLPARQRAVLILREVLRWKADEVAELLETSVVSVNSALQRARATLATRNVRATTPAIPDDEDKRRFLERYVDAFHRYDVDALVSLVHEDATLDMPPTLFWVRGRADLEEWWRGEGRRCAGAILVPVAANGSAACAAYLPSDGGGYDAGSVQVLDVTNGRITAIHAFLDPTVFTLFDLPLHRDG